MARVQADRVLETTTTTGTGALTLAGAVTGYQTFGAACSDADTVLYSLWAVDSAGQPTGDWETGLGTWNTGGTLTRTTVYASSNSGSAVSLSAGTKRVALSQIATLGWRDIIGNVHPKATGAGSPARAVYRGGTVGQYAWVANDVCDFEFHIPHDYVPGTDIYWHVHWSHNGTSISGNAVFDVYYTYSKGHNQANFPAEKNLTITYNTTDISTTPQYRHRIDEVIMSGASATATLMDRDDIEPDGLIIATMKLTTLPTIGSGSLFVHTCDIHYQSTNHATPNKSPDFYTPP